MKIVGCALLLLTLATRAALNSSDAGTGLERSANNSNVILLRSKTRETNLKDLNVLLRQGTNASNSSTQLTATRQGPCQCKGGVCGCCSRILYDTWKQKACVNVTYDPDEFSFTANVLMNDKILYTRSVSGKNPRPICVPVPRVPFIKACVRFYNIFFQGRNMHICINMEGKFRDTTLFKVGLDCMRFGANGVALVKPEDGGGLGQVEILPDDDTGDDNDDDDDDYSDDDYDDDDDDDDFF